MTHHLANVGQVPAEDEGLCGRLFAACQPLLEKEPATSDEMKEMGQRCSDLAYTARDDIVTWKNGQLITALFAVYSVQLCTHGVLEAAHLHLLASVIYFFPRKKAAVLFADLVPRSRDTIRAIWAYLRTRDTGRDLGVLLELMYIDPMFIAAMVCEVDCAGPAECEDVARLLFGLVTYDLRGVIVRSGDFGRLGVSLAKASVNPSIQADDRQKLADVARAYSAQLADTFSVGDNSTKNDHESLAARVAISATIDPMLTVAERASLQTVFQGQTKIMKMDVIHSMTRIGSAEGLQRLLDVLSVDLGEGELNEPIFYGNRLAHVAARNGDIDVLSILEQAGADLDAVNFAGDTPRRLIEECAPSGHRVKAARG